MHSFVYNLNSFSLMNWGILTWNTSMFCLQDFRKTDSKIIAVLKRIHRVVPVLPRACTGRWLVFSVLSFVFQCWNVESSVVSDPHITEGVMLLTIYRYSSSNSRALGISNVIQPLEVLVIISGNWFWLQHNERMLILVLQLIRLSFIILLKVNS